MPERMTRPIPQGVESLKYDPRMGATMAGYSLKIAPCGRNAESLLGCPTGGQGGLGGQGGQGAIIVNVVADLRCSALYLL
jgi:hypothetical protein